MKRLNKLLIFLTLLSPLANADDIFSEVWDWAKDNPEISIPSAVVGVPVAIAAAPMIASYVLFPFASVASGLMPEFSSEMAGVVTGEAMPRAIPGAIIETEGRQTGFIWRGLSEAEAEIQRATYLQAVRDNQFTAQQITRLFANPVMPM
jgi:hypothetical protein